MEMIRSALALSLALAAGAATAQDTGDGKYPWEEYDKLVKAKGAITAHGPTLFGDDVSLYNGALSFSAVDVSIPGNGGLPVALGRKYAVVSRKGNNHQQPFGDWEIDTPHLSGVFAPDWPDQRCSVTTLAEARPPAISSGETHFNAEDYWQGNQASLPGGGEMLLADQGAPQPGTGGPYHWLTSGRTYFSCLDSIRNGSGEGFLAITADGTKYWFDWMAQYAEAPLIGSGKDQINGGRIPRYFPRRKNVLYATRVEDRFGNWVTYTYSNQWNAPARLTNIDSSDGRSIVVGYRPEGQIGTVTAGDRTWTYRYNDLGPNFSLLSEVVLPDGSSWKIDFATFSTAQIEYEQAEHSTDVVRSCASPGFVVSDGMTGTITHPAGAVGQFYVAPKRHGRSNVPMVCLNWQSPTNDPNDDVGYYPLAYDSFTLMTKQVTGPGLDPMLWQYAYGTKLSWAEGTGPTCTTGDCGAPVCVSDDCAGTAVTTVTEPDGDWTRHTFGNSYRYNEGKLIRVEQGSAANAVLRTDTTGYVLAASGQAFGARIGTSPQPRGDNFASEAVVPQRSKLIEQDGATFSWQVAADCTLGLCFDEFARPTKVTKASSLGYSATYLTAYHDDPALWVLGQVASIRHVESGLEPQRTDYGYKALPLRKYAFGQLVHTLGYYTGAGVDGLLHTFTDANEKVTTLGGWYRGVPKSIAHPDGTTESAQVNPDGTIASATDEAGATSSYRYDAMGRLERVIHPLDPDVVWNDTVQSFAPSTVSAYGLAAGHWQQHVSTGNARKVTYYDALWRPVLEHEYDAADPTGTARFKRFAHDHDGRATFASYPAGTSAVSTGVWTGYDALGRVTSVSQDSEQGPLVTLTQYLPGFLRRTVNPRNEETIERFQAFDTPSYDAPVLIDAPEGTRTTIERDAFGKPTSMTRGGR